MAWYPKWEKVFYPESVAFVGVSADARREDLWQTGGPGFIRSYEQLGFKGRIYPVNPKAAEILGYKAFPNIVSIPEKVDLVVVCVPAQAVIEVLEDCIKANVRNVHVFTAGFEETGEKEGEALGKRVRAFAQTHGLNLIGPNCMGFYVPEAGIGPFIKLTPKSGPVAFLSQSGGHLNWYGHYGPNYGIYFSKGISFGNAYILDSTDFLEYLANDSKTRYICMYLEGVKDGAKLYRQVREINRVKPVIIMKAGLTATGARAVASHTGSLAGQGAVWNGFFAQTGAVQVFTLEELAEVTMAFLCLKPPAGNRVAIAGFGGGMSVSAADVCSREGLAVPTLTENTQRELKKFVRIAGSSIKNPLDTSPVFRDMQTLKREVDLVASDPAIDMLILMPHFDQMRRFADEAIDYLRDIAKNHPSGKPIVFVPHSFFNDPWEAELRRKILIDFPNEGIATYSSLTSASRALFRFARWHQVHKEMYSVPD